MISAWANFRRSYGRAVTWRIVESNRSEFKNQSSLREEDRVHCKQLTISSEKHDTPLRGTINAARNIVKRTRTPRDEVFQSNFRAYPQSLTIREQKWFEAKSRWLSGLKDCLLTSQINTGEVIPSEKLNTRKMRSTSQNMTKVESRPLPRIANNLKQRAIFTTNCESDSKPRTTGETWTDPELEEPPKERKKTTMDEERRGKKKMKKSGKGFRRSSQNNVDLDIVGEASLIYQKTSSSYTHSPKIQHNMLVIKQGGLDG